MVAHALQVVHPTSCTPGHLIPNIWELKPQYPRPSQVTSHHKWFGNSAQLLKGCPGPRLLAPVMELMQKIKECQSSGPNNSPMVLGSNFKEQSKDHAFLLPLEPLSVFIQWENKIKETSPPTAHIPAHRVEKAAAAGRFALCTAAALLGAVVFGFAEVLAALSAGRVATVERFALLGGRAVAVAEFVRVIAERAGAVASSAGAVAGFAAFLGGRPAVAGFVLLAGRAEAVAAFLAGRPAVVAGFVALRAGGVEAVAAFLAGRPAVVAGFVALRAGGVEAVAGALEALFGWAGPEAD